MPASLNRPLQIGWLDNWGGAYSMDSEIRSLCEKAVHVFDGLGHQVTVMKPPFAAEELWEAWVLLRNWAISSKLGHLLDNHPEEMLKPELRWEIECGRAARLEDIEKASAIRSAWFKCTANMDADVIALPSAQIFPFDAELHWPDTIGDVGMDTYHRWMEVVVPASLTGLPALNIPAGFGQNGLPIGLQLIGHRGMDSSLIALSREYESATDWIKKSPIIG